jgi:pimeloyl-ACP methyl ester carboxylesterase
MGLSSGGPYVVACAARLPQRVTAAAVIAGVTDMSWPEAWTGYDEGEATIMRLGDEAAAAAWCEEHYGSDGARFFEDAGEMAPADVALLSDEAMATALFTSMGEAFRQGVGGFAQDITVQAGPWSFDVSAIAAPTTVFHGDADTLVPIAHGRHTAQIIPGATFVELSGHGHISTFGEVPRICSELAHK